MELAPAVQHLLISHTKEHYLHSTLSLLRAAETGSVVPVYHNNDTISEDEELTGSDVRREVCRQSHRLFNQIDTLKDWNMFLNNVV